MDASRGEDATAAAAIELEMPVCSTRSNSQRTGDVSHEAYQ